MITTNNSKAPAEQEILEGLSTNLNLSRELLATLEEECGALRTMDTQGLFRICRQKETLVAKIQYLDNSLRHTLTGAGNAQAAAPPPEHTRLIGQYREKIKAMRQEIHSRNMINKRFTEDTLGYLSDAIALITRPAQADHTYRIPGRSQPRGKSLPSFISRGV